MTFTIADDGNIWVWTALTESLYPDRKAGESVWKCYQIAAPMQWKVKGWIEQRPVKEVIPEDY